MDLSQYRNEIDSIDQEITRLFERRMEVATKIAQFKIDNNLPIFNGARENEVIEKNVRRLEDEQYAPLIRKFYTSLMEISREHQGNLFGTTKSNKNGKIGYQGVQGSFSEEAALKYFGEERKMTNYDSFQDVFEAIKSGEIDYGILPVENSSTGAITEVYDLLNKYGFYIVGEEGIKIDQHLIGVTGTTVDTIKEVYSHSQGFEQSDEFLKAYVDWSLIPYKNTAISAKMVSELKDITKAAIGSKRAAEIYSLDIIKEKINNHRENTTRFIVIGKELEQDSSFDKVSVVFSLEDEAGTLYSLLSHFAVNKINLMHIESRPMKNSPWKYLLYVDFLGNMNVEAVKNVLKLIQDSSRYFKLLGNYKKFQ